MDLQRRLPHFQASVHRTVSAATSLHLQARHRRSSDNFSAGTLAARLGRILNLFCTNLSVAFHAFSNRAISAVGCFASFGHGQRRPRPAGPSQQTQNPPVVPGSARRRQRPFPRRLLHRCQRVR